MTKKKHVHRSITKELQTNLRLERALIAVQEQLLLVDNLAVRRHINDIIRNALQ